MTTKTKLETKWAVELVRNFEALTPLSLRDRKSGKSVEGEWLPGWQARAIETAQHIKTEYELPQSALSAKKRLLSELTMFDKSWLRDEATYHPVKTTIAHFRECLNLLFAEYQNQVNTDYKDRVDHRSSDENRIECDIGVYLSKAHSVLTEVANGATRKEVKWQDVSCALALVTGRRMSEIHQSGVFTALGDYELRFTGQLKGRGRKVDGQKLIENMFVIPTLVNTALVMTALEWLNNEGKRLGTDGTPEQVNKTWGKYLSQRTKSDWQVITDEEWQQVDLKDKWTYHKLRGMYFIACVNNYEKRGVFASISRMAPDILGDSNLQALVPYMRIDLTPGSLTKI